MFWFIYSVRNKINSKVYIGASTSSIKTVLSEWANPHSYVSAELYVDILIHGSKNFEVQSLQAVILPDQLEEVVEHWKEEKQSYRPFGYNRKDKQDRAWSANLRTKLEVWSLLELAHSKRRRLQERRDGSIREVYEIRTHFLSDEMKFVDMCEMVCRLDEILEPWLKDKPVNDPAEMSMLAQHGALRGSRQTADVLFVPGRSKSLFSGI